MARAKAPRKTRILVAEDDPLIAFDTVCILRKAGFDIAGPARSRDEAIALARSEKVDLALLDLYLGEATVEPAAIILQKRNVPIIFYTGHHHPERHLLAFPRSSLVTKPASERLLLRTIANVCQTGAAKTLA